MNIKLILGSASARRRKILTELGVSFEVVIPEVEEVMYRGDPVRTVRENAVLKNDWCRSRYPEHQILTADTIVSLNSQCVEKPISMQEAMGFLRKFSGQVHQVLTGVCLAGKGQINKVEVVESEVEFKTLTEPDIHEYVQRVDPMDKAGAYDIDQHSDLIIKSYSGSRTNIMGLPAELVRKWLSF
ncbi:Maf family protein [Verrucomicrobiota bacterium]